MAKELIINATLPETRIALMEEGRIQELLIERESDRGIVGNIYKGRVTRVLPGMQAAFVDVGLDKAAFLYVDDIYVHPKVMGEENEVEGVDEEVHAEGETQESHSEPTAEEHQEAEAHMDAHMEAASEGEVEDVSEDESSESSEDSSALESHAAEHAEQELTQDDASEEEGDEGSDEDAGEEEGVETLEASDAGEAAAPTEGADGNTAEGTTESQPGALEGFKGAAGNRRPRGRRNRKRGGRGGKEGKAQFAGGESHEDPANVPESMTESLNDVGNVESDRTAMAGEERGAPASRGANAGFKKSRPEFREQRNRDRRIKSKHSRPRAQAQIGDLLKEGQEVIVQVAKDPIATKGARLTCHVSLPGRHLVCMPSIDHVGVSRRIERDDERRRLRDFVEKNRPRKMGFIVRTASGGKDPESWIKQDIDYLSKLWGGIRTKADEVSAPALVYEDLNSILRAIRDWVNEDIERIIVDTRYYYNELMAFSERFMPSLIDKIELYQGDIPVFDAYGLSSELNRSLERRVWLKSGGYIVIDQAEALVAIDVNTGRFVGKKNLEDTILKTNLEAAEEIAYQLRLRNCGGIIIVDFIDMERDDNKMRVYRALDEALKKDRARPTIQKISELGLVEMTRKRTRDTIVRTLCEPCTHCEGKGFTKSTKTVAYEILREIERLSVDREAKKILVSAHETVINILAIELRDAADQLERRYNKSIYLQTVMDFHNEQFEVVTDRAQGKKQTQDIARQLRIERERTERKEKQQKRREPIAPRERNHDRDEEYSAGPSRGSNEDSAPQVEEKPKPKPSGAFIARVKPIMPKAPSAEGVEAAPGNEASAPSGNGDSQDENNFSESGGNVDYNSPSVGLGQEQASASHQVSEMDEEDQLAFLRAQAAQDAAIAGGGVPANGNSNRGGGRQNNGRHQNGGRHQNNRNQNNRNGGGRNNQGRHQGRHGGGHHANGNGNGNARFRPNNNDNYGNTATVGAQAAASQPIQAETAAVEVPDYEVLNRGGDGSNS